MPKINVYLPDELAEAVRDTGVPVSAVCQRALEQAVRRITAIRESSLADVTPEHVAQQFPQFTGRAQAVVAGAVDGARAGAAPAVGTGHLLAAMLAEGGNVGVNVLRAIEVDPAQVAQELARQSDVETGDGPGAEAARRFSAPAVTALQTAVAEATSLGHNYVGCEHLLLGLVGEPDGVAGRVLRARGADARLTRRAVVAWLSGYVHLREQSPDPAQTLRDALQEHLRPLVERLDRLERRVGAARG